MTEPKNDSKESLNIAFIHPDLGIGGAERLIVDAAMALQSVGNQITVYTSHCDKSHCFEEVKRNELKVMVYGDFLPTSFRGKFHIVFAFLRQLYLSLKLIASLRLFKHDVVIIDQLSYCIPLLYLFGWNTQILFYCHFPDKLLAPHTSLLRSVYRLLFDAIEELSTSCSDKIVVNSNFTKSVVGKTFRLLDAKKLDVVYPCVSTDKSTFTPSDASLTLVHKLLNNNSYFLSINRYERKKNIALALQAYSKYLENTKDASQSLVVSGGYDPRVSENVEYLNELQLLCDSLNLSYTILDGKNLETGALKNYEAVPNVIFLTSVSSDFKNALISQCDMLLYTPTNEHFGIVPLEAMRMGKLVLADNSGGPLETVSNFFDDKNTYTGFTVDSDAEKWTDVLEWVKDLSDHDLRLVSERSIKRVDENFSFSALRDQLVNIIHAMRKEKDNKCNLLFHAVFPIISISTFVFIIRLFC